MGVDHLLEERESVLWRGRPKQGLLLRKRDFYLVPYCLVFGIPVSVFTVFVFSVLQVPQSFGVYEFIIVLFYVILGMAFLLPQYVMYGRFIFDAFLRPNTEYFVTNKRAFIQRRVFKGEEGDIRLTRGLPIAYTGKRRGTIKFGRQMKLPLFSAIVSPLHELKVVHRDNHPFCFEQIQNVRDVYDLIRSIQMGE